MVASLEQLEPLQRRTLKVLRTYGTGVSLMPTISPALAGHAGSREP